MEFRLVSDIRENNKKDNIGFYYKYQYNHDKGTEKYSVSRMVVACIYQSNGISEEPFEKNDTTATNHIVLKVLHKNKKGVFYTIKNGKGYGVPTERVYLTEFEVLKMDLYLATAYQHHKDIIVEEEKIKELEK